MYVITVRIGPSIAAMAPSEARDLGKTASKVPPIIPLESTIIGKATSGCHHESAQKIPMIKKIYKAVIEIRLEITTKGGKFMPFCTLALGIVLIIIAIKVIQNHVD